MFKSKIFRVAYAITQAEGWYAAQANTPYPSGSASYRRHNPGNIRLSSYAIGTDNNFAVFENDLVGYYAIVHQLWLYASGKSQTVSPTMTIGVMMSKYNGTTIGTPNYENYMQIVEKVGGVSRNDLVNTLLP